MAASEGLLYLGRQLYIKVKCCRKRKGGHLSQPGTGEGQHGKVRRFGERKKPGLHFKYL